MAKKKRFFHPKIPATLFRICLIPLPAGFCIRLIWGGDFQNMQKQFQNLQNLRRRTKYYCMIRRFFLSLPTEHNTYPKSIT
jgi:hypothetical protein